MLQGGSLKTTTLYNISRQNTPQTKTQRCTIYPGSSYVRLLDRKVTSIMLYGQMVQHIILGRSAHVLHDS